MLYPGASAANSSAGGPGRGVTPVVAGLSPSNFIAEIALGCAGACFLSEFSEAQRPAKVRWWKAPTTSLRHLAAVVDIRTQ